MSLSVIPHINLLVLTPEYSSAWQEALKAYDIADQISFTTHQSLLSELGSEVKSDLIVSPANSHAIMDGGFDDAISKALSPRSEYLNLTRHCQAVVFDKFRGFQPPGTCVLVRLPDNLLGVGGGGGASNNRNVWGIEYVAMCPTMRTPRDCTWDREVVYECVWSLLCEIDRHNQRVGAVGGGRLIERILMTPLATGTGGVSAKKWACQAALAIRHFLDAAKNPDQWRAMDWAMAKRFAREVEATHAF